jgi:hypothetical protein
MRLLVVPMGDPSEPLSSQFPDEARAGTVQAMQALGRMLPVATGTGDLVGLSGGLRYRILDNTLIDARAGFIDSVGFCGLSGNFAPIKVQLAQALQAWNSANPLAPADRVLGVIADSISGGSKDGCAEGFAALNSREGWARVGAADPDGRGGSLAAMEIAHTFGLITSGDRLDLGYHSKNIEAAPTEQPGAYNTSTREHVGRGRSALRMRVTGWNDFTVLYEEPDWAHLQCRLTSAALPGGDCPSPGFVGSAGAVPSFVIAGSTNVTATSNPSKDQTDAHSYYAADVEVDADPTSPYTLEFRDRHGQVLGSYGVPVRTEESSHAHGDDGSDSGTHAVETYLFEFSAEPPDGAARVELRHTHRSAPLYARDINEPPVITGTTYTTTDDQNLTSTPTRAERDVAISDDGLLYAWADETGIRVRPAGATADTATIVGSEPAWEPASGPARRLAFVRGNDLWTVSVDSATGTVIAGSERRVYDAALQTELRLQGDSAAHHPTWAPAGNAGGSDRIAVEIAGDIWVLELERLVTEPLVCRALSLPGSGCHRLAGAATTSAERSPAWGPDGRIAFHVETAQGDEIRVHTPSLTGGTVSATGLAGRDPAWSGADLAFEGGGDVYLADGRDFHPVALTVRDARGPALDHDGATLLFTRAVSGTPDVFRAGTSRRKVTVTATDESPGVLRLDLFLECTTATTPLKVGLRPTSTTAGSATFSVEYDSSRACPGTLLGRVTDGYHVTWTEIAPVGLARDPSYPVGSIYSPMDGSTVPQGAGISLAGAAFDPNGPVRGSRLRWSVITPAGTVVAAGTGERPGEVRAPAGSWQPGDHHVVLDVLGPDGAVERSLSSTVHVCRDADNDGRCAPTTSPPRPCDEDDSDPTDGYRDSDGDGIVDTDDPDPCVNANNAVLDFDPDLLYVPSSGQPVSVRITSHSVALQDVDPASVRITRAGGWGYVLPAVSWKAERRGVWVAKFDRQELTTFLASKGLTGRYVPIVIEGSSGTTSFRGLDPASPVTQPS